MNVMEDPTLRTSAMETEVLAEDRAKPKRQRAKKEKATNNNQKPKKGVSIGVILFVLLLLAVAVFGVLFYFDMFHLKGKVAKVFGVDTYIEEQVKQEKEDLELATTKVETREKELDKREKDLAKKESDLDTRETKITERQGELDTLLQQLEGKKTDLGTIVEIFEKMDASAAADIISNLPTVETMIRVLGKMSPDKSAAILNRMDKQLSSRIIAAMLKE